MESYLVNPTNFPGWIPGSYDRPVLWKHLDLRGERPMYYLCLARAGGSGAGRPHHAADEDGPGAAGHPGQPPGGGGHGRAHRPVQLTGFVLAGVIAGAAGALHATLLRGVGYQTYPVATSILVFSMAVIGGISSLGGTLIGVGFVQAHLAYEVDDVEALCQRMKSAGYRESTPPNAHPYRKRRYFYDPEGNNWEFIQYLSKDPAERNDYKLPDR